MPLQSILSDYAAVGPSLADPPGSSVLVAAVAWLEAALLGTVATTLAVIAVAAIGFMMLTGRMSLRPALTVVLGCFILFGASTIVAGFRGTMRSAEPFPGSSAAAHIASAPAPQQYSAELDPYAGASVPTE